MVFSANSSNSFAVDAKEEKYCNTRIGAMQNITMDFWDFIDSLTSNIPLNTEKLERLYGFQGEEKNFMRGVVDYHAHNIVFSDGSIVEELSLRDLDNERAYGFIISLEMKNSFSTKQEIEKKFGHDFRMIGIPRPDHLEKTYGYAKQYDGYEIRVGYSAQSGYLTSFSISSVLRR